MKIDNFLETDVFISYSRADHLIAERLARDLKARGVRVWWDAELRPGDPFHKQIASNIANARRVIVLWSRSAENSDYVMAEAEQARQHDKLIPVRLDQTELPMTIRHNLHIVSLEDWRRGLHQILRGLDFDTDAEPPAGPLPETLTLLRPPPAGSVAEMIWDETVARLQLLASAYYNGEDVQQDLEIARAFKHQCAAMGSVEALYDLGLQYWIGASLPKDDHKAFAYLSAGASKDHPPSIGLLGRLFEEGMGIPLDLERARALYEKAVAHGDDAAMLMLAGMYRTGRGALRDPNKARALLERSAKLGNSYALVDLAELLLSDPDAPDTEAALRHYRLASEQGNEWAALRLGMMHMDTASGSADLEAAAAHFEKARAAGLHWAAFFLGQIYEKSDTSPRLQARARECYREAAGYGNGWAAYMLALMFRDGRGGAPDPEAYLRLLKQSAASGNVGAFMELAVAHEKGLMMSRSMERAREYFSLAADAGFDIAAWNLARLCDEGTGGPYDPEMAAQMVLRAAELGSEKARLTLGDDLAGWTEETKRAVWRALGQRPPRAAE